MTLIWLAIADFALNTPLPAQKTKGARVHILLFTIVGALGLCLFVVHPAAAQNEQAGNGVGEDAQWQIAHHPSSSAPRPAFQDGVQAIDTPNIDDEIVYIDDQGFIHVFDPTTLPDMPPLNFRSPDSGWFNAIVADVNGDGDDEIIAIASNGLFKIYDPVVNTTAIQLNQEFNGFYWEELFVAELVDQPLLLADGEFDGNPQTREIVVVLKAPQRPGESLIQIWWQPAPPFDGRVWQVLTDVRLRATATDIATGDLDGSGLDNIAIVSRGSGRLSVFRRESNNVLREFWFSASQQRPWTGVAIGNVATDSPLAELVAVRSVAPPFASLVVQRYRPVDQFEDVLLREHLPAPRQVFIGNATGAATGQIFMLRDVPPDDARPRLFNSRTGSGANFGFEVRLDTDNGYRTAAVGDLDSDGKDEIAIVRNNGILIFQEPATSTTMTQTLTTPTNARTLALGNLDALGRDLLSSNQTQLTFRVAAGQVSDPQSLIMTNRTRAGPISFQVATAPAVGFLEVTPTSASTPASIIVTANATDLLPITELNTEEQRRLGIVDREGAAGYGTNLVFSSPNLSVLNSPLTIPVFIEVTPGIVLRPSHIDVGLIATESSPDCQASLPLTVEVAVLGTTGSTFIVNAIGANAASTTLLGATSSADIEWPSSVPWLAVTSPTATAPTTLRLTIKPEWVLAPPNASAEIVLTSTVPGAAQNPTVRRVPVRVSCYTNSLHLPMVLR